MLKWQIFSLAETTVEPSGVTSITRLGCKSLTYEHVEFDSQRDKKSS